MDRQQLVLTPGGSVLLNIGEDAGAPIPLTSPTLTRGRIDLIPETSDEPQVRGAVRERDLPQGVTFADVYPPLRQEIYSIEGYDQKKAITTGRVTTLNCHEGCCRIYYHSSTRSVLAHGC